MHVCSGKIDRASIVSKDGVTIDKVEDRESVNKVTVARITLKIIIPTLLITTIDFFLFLDACT